MRLIVTIWIIATFEPVLTVAMCCATQMKRNTSFNADGYSSADFSSDNEDDDNNENPVPKVAKKAGAKSSDKMPWYHLCNAPKDGVKVSGTDIIKNKPVFCKKQLVNGTEVVCKEHIDSLTHKIPAVVGLMKAVRAKLLDITKGNKPRSAAAERQALDLYTTYRQCLLLMVKHKQENPKDAAIIEGFTYTFDFIKLFDDAYNLGVSLSIDDDETYDKLVKLRRTFILRRIMQLREEQHKLEAEYRNYASKEDLADLLAQAATLREPAAPPAGDAGASTSGAGAGAAEEDDEMEEALPEGGQDYADSD